MKGLKNYNKGFETNFQAEIFRAIIHNIVKFELICDFVPMHLIPVLDIRNGVVVQAKLGHRDKYDNLQSMLCADIDPVIVTQSFLNLYPFKTIYIADLDALAGKGIQLDIIFSLLNTFPHTEFWLDSGVFILPGNTEYKNYTRVLGTETDYGISDIDMYAELGEIVLSLDFHRGELMGQNEVLQQPEHWPGKVIVMSLDKVGSEGGPDMDRLLGIRDIDESKSYYAAGGIRDVADIQLLQGHGFSGALVASSLHNGTLTSEDLLRLSRLQ